MRNALGTGEARHPSASGLIGGQNRQKEAFKSFAGGLAQIAQKPEESKLKPPYNGQ